MDTTSYHSAVGFEQISVGATAVGIDFAPTGRPAKKAHISVETQAIRYRYDGGDPTAALGHPVAAGETFEVFGPENLERLRLIAQTPTAIVHVTVEES